MTVLTHLKVQVRSGALTGRADRSEQLTALKTLPEGDINSIKVRIARRRTVCVTQLNQLTIAPFRACKNDLGVQDGANRGARRRSVVDAGVVVVLTGDWMHARSKGARSAQRACQRR